MIHIVAQDPKIVLELFISEIYAHISAFRRKVPCVMSRALKYAGYLKHIAPSTLSTALAITVFLTLVTNRIPR